MPRPKKDAHDKIDMDFNRVFAIMGRSTINFQFIMSKCPNAYEKIIVSATEIGMNITFAKIMGGNQMHTRLLYDLFDEEGIAIMVFKEDTSDFWAFYITQKDTENFGSSHIYNSRIEAENSAFMEAFKYLEKTLT
jgi:hypothetical protein